MSSLSVLIFLTSHNKPTWQKEALATVGHQTSIITRWNKNLHGSLLLTFSKIWGHFIAMKLWFNCYKNTNIIFMFGFRQHGLVEYLCEMWAVYAPVYRTDSLYIYPFGIFWEIRSGYKNSWYYKARHSNKLEHQSVQASYQLTLPVSNTLRSSLQIDRFMSPPSLKATSDLSLLDHLDLNRKELKRPEFWVGSRFRSWIAGRADLSS